MKIFKLKIFLVFMCNLSKLAFVNNDEFKNLKGPLFDLKFGRGWILVLRVSRWSVNKPTAFT